MAHLKVIFFLKLLILSVFLNIAQATFCSNVAACKCTSRRIDCSGVGVDPMSLRLNLTFLDYNFTNNKVGAVNNQLFSHLKAVQYLMLCDNGITEIAPDAFAQNPDLVQLNLSYNKLKQLPSTMLRNNLNLREFYCEYNNLTTIDGKLFLNLKFLQIVFLERNQLLSIPPETFSTNTMISRLYLEENKLETAYKDWLEHFNHSKSYEFYLDDNPWSCDCRMRSFKSFLIHKKWLSKTNQETRRLSLPKCHYDDGRSPISINEVPLNNFTCESPRPNIKAMNCTSDTNICKFKFKEGSPAALHCVGEGKPTPKAEIMKSAHREIHQKQKKSSVSWSWNKIMLDDDGDYVCILTGYNSTGAAVQSRTLITVVVESTSSPTIGIVLGLLLGVIAIIGLTYLFRHYKKRTGYNSLSHRKSPDIYYDINEDEAQIVSEVTYLHDDSNEADEEEHYVKNNSTIEPFNDEQEVLV